MRTAQVLHLPGNEVSLQVEIEKLRHQLRMIQVKLDEMIHLHHQKADRTISVYVRGQYRLIHISEIIMIKSMNNYSTIYLDSGEAIMTSRTLKYWEGQCGSEDLVRVHNSFLVHRNKITAIRPDQCAIVMHGGFSALYTRKAKTLLLGLLGHTDQTPKAKTPKFALKPKS